MMAAMASSPSTRAFSASQSFAGAYRKPGVSGWKSWWYSSWPRCRQGSHSAAVEAVYERHYLVALIRAVLVRGVFAGTFDGALVGLGAGIAKNTFFMPVRSHSCSASRASGTV